MFFFDVALITIVGGVSIAAVIGVVALISGFVHRRRHKVEGDGRDTEWILHGEGHRDF